MTVAWRHLQPGETDHELLWGLVGLSALVVAAAALAGNLPIAPACVFKVVTGVPCITCGSSRALAALAAGDLIPALRWNPLTACAAAAAAVYVPYGAAVGLARARRLRIHLQPREWQWVRASGLGSAAATWLFLLLDGR